MTFRAVYSPRTSGYLMLAPILKTHWQFLIVKQPGSLVDLSLPRRLLSVHFASERIITVNGASQNSTWDASSRKIPRTLI